MVAHLILFFDGETIPDGWTLVSDVGGAFYHKFIRGAATYGGTGGAETHTHTTSLVSCSEPSSYLTRPRGSAGVYRYSFEHTHELGNISADSQNNIPEYRSLKVISCDAGIPKTLPKGVITLFDTSPPTGWTRYAIQDGKYIRGDSEAGAMGGSNSHSHTVSGNTSTHSPPISKTDWWAHRQAAIDHYHSFSQSTSAEDNEPPYIEVFLGKLDGDSLIPEGMIGLFDDTPPLNWHKIVAFNQKFIKPANGYGTIGGNASHTHPDVEGDTGIASKSTGSYDDLTPPNQPTQSHTHTLTISLASADHTPPYIDVIFAKYFPPPSSQTVKAIGLNVHVKPTECKTVKTSVERLWTSTKSVGLSVGKSGFTEKDIVTSVVYYSWRTKPVQTKIWWNSGKTIRSVRAKVGEPANTKYVVAKLGFPANTKPVSLHTPVGYNESEKTVQLKVEKYSEMVTRIVVADTRQTAYSYITKPVSLNIGKYPYNGKSITAKVEHLGESIKPVSCDIWLAKGQSIKSVGCKVNKSRQIIDVGLSIQEDTGESAKQVGLNVAMSGESGKPVGLSIWSDLGETIKPVSLSVEMRGKSYKPVGLSIWSDLGETVRPTGLSAEIPGEAHQSVRLSVWSGLSETVKTIVVSVATYPETYKAVRANVSPTHRWIPVSANIVRSGVNYRAVKTNVINEVWAFNWQSINARIEKYAAHTKNIRARRKVQAKVEYFDGFHIRLVSANVSVPTANTRAVKLKIHMYSVYGTIADEEDNPVKDAVVFLYKRGSGEFITGKTTKTDSSGYYEIPEVPYGAYDVIVIKQAHTLNFGPIIVDGAHVDVEKNMPLYKVGKDTCLEEIMSPQGDIFRFQVLYDEVFPNHTRTIDILLIWGDLYGKLPTYYRETDGIFMVESPSSARLTALHDFWETGGERSQGKDDHFITPINNVSEFMWRASLYYPNFIGFIVRCTTRGDVYTILSANIGGHIVEGLISPEEPGEVTPHSYPPLYSKSTTTRPIGCCLPLPGIAGCPTACTRAVGLCRDYISQSIKSVKCHITLPTRKQSTRPVKCYITTRGVTTRPVGCCLPLPGIVGCPGVTTRPIGLTIKGSITSRPVRCRIHPPGVNTKTVKCYVRYPVLCKLIGPLPPVPYPPGYSSFPTVSGFILDESRHPTSGTVDVIDKETGILLYHCDVGPDGWYSFAVPPNRCYILAMCKPGYQCQMVEVCIGTTPVVDRNVTEFGGPPFECEINCYYYTRAFAFALLVPLADYYVYGHVYNSKTLEPLENVLVVAGDYEGTAVTDANGYYKMNIPAGTHHLEASKREFKRGEAEVTIASGVEQDFYLDPVVRVGITFTGGLTHKPIYM